MAQSPLSNVCVCSCQCLEVAQPQSPSLTGSVCICQYLEVVQQSHLQLCMCAHVHAWRWHSDTATISILNCVCVLTSMLISTMKHVLMSMLGGSIATIFILTRERVCVRMSMIGGGIATISILNRECVCLCHAWSGIAIISTLKLMCVYLLMSMLGGEEWEDLLGYKKKAYIHYNSNVF